MNKPSLALAALLLATTACQQDAPDPGPDSKNELPFGFVEGPPAGSIVKKQFVAGGWAMDDQGVKEVRLYVDNKFVARATVNQIRPDVTKAYPNYAASDKGFHGWTIKVTLPDVFAAGPHTLLVQAVDTEGATRDIGTVAVALER